MTNWPGLRNGFGSFDHQGAQCALLQVLHGRSMPMPTTAKWRKFFSIMFRAECLLRSLLGESLRSKTALVPPKCFQTCQLHQKGTKMLNLEMVAQPPLKLSWHWEGATSEPFWKVSPNHLSKGLQIETPALGLLSFFVHPPSCPFHEQVS